MGTAAPAPGSGDHPRITLERLAETGPLGNAGCRWPQVAIAETGGRGGTIAVAWGDSLVRRPSRSWPCAGGTLWRALCSPPNRHSRTAARKADANDVSRNSALCGAHGGVALATSLLWRRSERSRQHAEEARRAEAGKLLAMGERELERYPTASLAYTIKSLEVSDTDAARLLAIRILQREPVARLATLPKDLDGGFYFAFDDAANRFAIGGRQRVGVFGSHGGSPMVLGDYRLPGGRTDWRGFASGRDVLVANRQGDLRAWSLPDGRELGRANQDEGDSRWRSIGSGSSPSRRRGRASLSTRGHCPSVPRRSSERLTRGPSGWPSRETPSHTPETGTCSCRCWGSGPHRRVSWPHPIAFNPLRSRRTGLAWRRAMAAATHESGTLRRRHTIPIASFMPRSPLSILNFMIAAAGCPPTISTAATQWSVCSI